MFLKNNYTFAGIVLFIIWVSVLVFFFGGSIKADLTRDGGYEPAGGFGHPLYRDY